MTDIRRLRDELASALSSLSLVEGMYPATVSFNPLDFSEAQPCDTIFVTAFVLAATSHPPTRPLVNPFTRPLIEILASQINIRGSFNYWRKGSPSAERQPYPDDLDTTFCALTALAGQDGGLDGKTQAQATLLLLAAEAQTGGPYRTWFVPRDAPEEWRDVDIAVNAQVGRWLATQNVALANLTAYADQCLRDNRLASPYYHSVLPTLYYLSSWYRGSRMDAAVWHVKTAQRDDGSWGTPVDTAYALSALLRWRGITQEVERGIVWLATQSLETLSRPYAICIHQNFNGKPEYVGAPAATLALCIEALSLYEERAAAPVSVAIASEDPRNAQHAAVLAQVMARIDAMPQPLREMTREAIQQLLKTDHDRTIVLLPFVFAGTLAPDLRARVPDVLLISLGVANVFGWTAYTLVDDVIDGESSALPLPTAHACLRAVDEVCLTVLSDASGFPGVYRKIMDGIDAANAWELAHWRLRAEQGTFRVPAAIPEHETLAADRSFGHVLGPLAVLCAIGHGPESDMFRAVVSFFTKYLIARQLDDDAHDWEADLRRGQINIVSRDVLHSWMDANPSRSPETDRPLYPTELPALRRLFWEDRVATHCTNVLRICDEAEQSLAAASSIITNPAPLLSLLTPIRASARRALKERETAQAFLAAYKQPPMAGLR